MFLLSVLGNVKHEKYDKMYAKYKEIKIQRSTVRKKQYKAKLTIEFKARLKNFCAIIHIYFI